MEQELCMTRLDWFEDLTQLVWNICIKFDKLNEHCKMYVLEKNKVVIYGGECWEKTI